MKVGFIGLGNMGGPMARNLVAAGFECCVYNRTRSRSRSLEREGAVVAPSVPELVRHSDIILLCLANREVCRQILLGEEGVFSALGAGRVVVDHSTVDRALSLRCHERARSLDAGFLDAPISGGAGGARSTRLSIMVGGSEEDFQKSLPVFDAMAKTVVRMGGPGTGTATKLANQLLVSIHNLAACEAAALCRRMDVDLGKVAEALADGWASSRMLLRNLPLIQEERFGPSQAPLRHLRKDMGFVAAEASALGLELPLSDLIRERLESFIGEDKGEWDISSMAQLYSGQ